MPFDLEGTVGKTPIPIVCTWHGAYFSAGKGRSSLSDAKQLSLLHAGIGVQSSAGSAEAPGDGGSSPQPDQALQQGSACAGNARSRAGPAAEQRCGAAVLCAALPHAAVAHWQPCCEDAEPEPGPGTTFCCFIVSFMFLHSNHGVAPRMQVHLFVEGPYQ